MISYENTNGIRCTIKEQSSERVIVVTVVGRRLILAQNQKQSLQLVHKLAFGGFTVGKFRLVDP